jgi:predicted nucleic acid-binding protein
VRVFLDANILFSAAKSDGAVRRMLRLLLQGGHECVADTYVSAEARRNLAAKGSVALDALEALTQEVSVAACLYGDASAEVLDWLPDKDRPVLAAAIALGCDTLVTGDRTQFGAGYGKAFAGVTIHSPRSLIERVFS